MRPSLIALQMPMTEEDDVFVEKCFQRSLIELDKLVSFSGTPTVAWRRTGEICLVGPEFCMLSGWEREELVGVGKRKYIYEVRVRPCVRAAACLLPHLHPSRAGRAEGGGWWMWAEPWICGC